MAAASLTVSAAESMTDLRATTFVLKERGADLERARRRMAVLNMMRDVRVVVGGREEARDNELD